MSIFHEGALIGIHLHFFYNAHSKQNREKFWHQICQDRVRMFIPTFYSRVNFLLDRLTVLNDLRYDHARRIFYQYHMKDARAKSICRI